MTAGGDTPTLVFEPRRAKRAGLLIFVVGFAFALSTLTRGEACAALLTVPMTFLLSMMLAFGSDAARAMSWVVGLMLVATGATAAVRGGGGPIFDVPYGSLLFGLAGLVVGAFVITLVRVAKLRPEEESLFYEPLGGPLTPSVRRRLEQSRMPLPEEGKAHPASAQLVNTYWDRLDQDWHGVAPEARARNALPLYADVGGWIGLRRDGVAIEVSWWEDEPNGRQPDRPPEYRLKIAALANARFRYPEAAQLLPRKPPDAKRCADCAGAGRTEFEGYVDPLICGTCLGLGWRAT